MKKEFIVLWLIMFSFSYAVAQKNSKGTWNSTTATYRNDKYGVIWELPTELKWMNRPILTENTIFKVRNDDMLLTVSIRVIPYNGETVDIWSEECHVREMSEMSTKEEAKMYNMDYQWVDVRKTTFCEIHALRVVTDISRYNPNANSTIHTMNFLYEVSFNSRLYTIAVLAVSVRESEIEDFYEIADFLIEGFKFK